MVPKTVSDWFPDRPPTWMEVGIVVLFSVSTAIDLYPYDEISWTWVAVGFVLCGFGMGPAGTTSLGKRFGQWFRDIGGAGRVAVIVCFAVGVWWAMLTVDLPIAKVESFVAGLFFSLVVFLLAHYADAGEIDGWSAT
ncbi:hypothetical protein V5735_06405 (plasmid) [Haladaptatus sp. SPP-AMP-3]|uniref:hypothetical protein n=1 Tax=Haladaptatus sp. SPP-AMP-3 TaxID=3121295 RepID=UPI003C2CFA2B